jgi:hypothetical protein
MFSTLQLYTSTIEFEAKTVLPIISLHIPFFFTAIEFVSSDQQVASEG